MANFKISMYLSIHQVLKFAITRSPFGFSPCENITTWHGKQAWSKLEQRLTLRLEVYENLQTRTSRLPMMLSRRLQSWLHSERITEIVAHVSCFKGSYDDNPKGAMVMANLKMRVFDNTPNLQVRHNHITIQDFALKTTPPNMDGKHIKRWKESQSISDLQDLHTINTANHDQTHQHKTDLKENPGAVLWTCLFLSDTRSTWLPGANRDLFAQTVWNSYMTQLLQTACRDYEVARCFIDLIIRRNRFEDKPPAIQYDWQVDYCSPYLDSYY